MHICVYINEHIHLLHILLNYKYTHFTFTYSHYRWHGTLCSVNFCLCGGWNLPMTFRQFITMHGPVHHSQFSGHIRHADGHGLCPSMFQQVSHIQIWFSEGHFMHGMVIRLGSCLRVSLSYSVHVFFHEWFHTAMGKYRKCIDKANVRVKESQCKKILI